jgi:flagellar biosynthesis protein FlhA
VKPRQLQKVLQDLLLEGVSIRDTETILESTGSSFSEELKYEKVLAGVRRSLARALASSRLETDGQLHAIILDPELENLVESRIIETVDGEMLSLEAMEREQIRAHTSEKLTELRAAGHKSVVLCRSEIRRHLWKLLGTRVPGLSVLAYEEVSEDIKVELHGTVDKEMVP